MTLVELLNETAELNKREAEHPLTDKELAERFDVLMETKASVFVFHMKDGTSRISSDALGDREDMELFFKQYPQEGCESVEFLK